MSEHVKTYNSLPEMLIAVQAMTKFQRIHNVIRNDYIELLRITDQHQKVELEFDALYRACLTRLFTLIEADIYGLNRLDPFDGYDDKGMVFIEKFKATFKQVCKTWNKDGLRKHYFDRKLQALKTLKKKRDELVHPKELVHLHKASFSDFQAIRDVFDDYDKFINDLMDDFFVGSTISLSS